MAWLLGRKRARHAPFVESLYAPRCPKRCLERVVAVASSWAGPLAAPTGGERFARQKVLENGVQVEVGFERVGELVGH